MTKIAPEATADAASETTVRAIPASGVTSAADTSFLNEHDPTELPVWVRAVAKLAAAGYHEPSARDTRQRIIAFFDAHLKP